MGGRRSLAQSQSQSLRVQTTSQRLQEQNQSLQKQYHPENENNLTMFPGKYNNDSQSSSSTQQPFMHFPPPPEYLKELHESQHPCNVVDRMNQRYPDDPDCIEYCEDDGQLHHNNKFQLGASSCGIDIGRGQHHTDLHQVNFFNFKS